MSKEITRLNHEPRCFASISDNSFLSGGREGNIFLWKEKGGNEKIEMVQCLDAGRTVNNLFYFYRMFVAVLDNGELQRWEADGQNYIFTKKKMLSGIVHVISARKVGDWAVCVHVR